MYEILFMRNHLDYDIPTIALQEHDKQNHTSVRSVCHSSTPFDKEKTIHA
jgi:hypothetical protein